MSLTPSTMMKLGTLAPEFTLPDTNGQQVSLSDYLNCKASVVMFICNHCPYVIHVAQELAEFSMDYQKKGVGIVGIMSNDVENYPDDSPQKMKVEKADRGYPFAYLYDQTQEVAKAYQAACTPDFFVFDGDMALVYRGQLDASRPQTDVPVTGKDLRSALDAVLDGRNPDETQYPSMGCNIKWKPGQAPAYAMV